MELSDLGITAADLQERVIVAVAAKVLSGTELDEDGDVRLVDSRFAKALDKRVRKHIDEKIEELASKHILPNVKDYIEGLSLQESTKWGEKVGKPVTFVEYLVLRAEAYLTEKVDFDGKAKNDNGSYNWSGVQTRITHLVHQHLQFSINTALTSALKTVNESIAGGIAETVKLQLAKITAGISATVRS